MKKITVVVAVIATFALTACTAGSSKTIVKTLDPETGKVLTETETYNEGFMKSLTDATSTKIVVASVDSVGAEISVTSGAQASNMTPAAEMSAKKQSAKYVTVPQDATPEAINATANLVSAVTGNLTVTTDGIGVNTTTAETTTTEAKTE